MCSKTAGTGKTALFLCRFANSGRIVQEAGAVAILDRGSVFLTADEIDITEGAIRQLDEAIGAGLIDPLLRQTALIAAALAPELAANEAPKDE